MWYNAFSSNHVHIYVGVRVQMPTCSVTKIMSTLIIPSLLGWNKSVTCFYVSSDISTSKYTHYASSQQMAKIKNMLSKLLFCIYKIVVVTPVDKTTAVQ